MNHADLILHTITDLQRTIKKQKAERRKLARRIGVLRDRNRSLTSSNEGLRKLMNELYAEIGKLKGEGDEG